MSSYGGELYVTVRPDTQDFGGELTGQVTAAATKAASEAGSAAGRAYKQSFQQQVSQLSPGAQRLVQNSGLGALQADAAKSVESLRQSTAEMQRLGQEAQRVEQQTGFLRTGIIGTGVVLGVSALVNALTEADGAAGNLGRALQDLARLDLIGVANELAGIGSALTEDTNQTLRTALLIKQTTAELALSQQQILDAQLAGSGQQDDRAAAVAARDRAEALLNDPNFGTLTTEQQNAIKKQVIQAQALVDSLFKALPVQAQQSLLTQLSVAQGRGDVQGQRSALAQLIEQFREQLKNPNLNDKQLEGVGAQLKRFTDQLATLNKAQEQAAPDVVTPTPFGVRRQVDVAVSRAQASGNQDAIIAARRAQIALDEKYIKIQEDLLKRGGENAGVHADNLKKLYADKASAQGEIDSIERSRQAALEAAERARLEAARRAAAAAAKAAAEAERLRKEREAAEEAYRLAVLESVDKSNERMASFIQGIKDGVAQAEQLAADARAVREASLANRVSAARLTESTADDKRAIQAQIRYFQERVKETEGLERERARASLIAAQAALKGGAATSAAGGFTLADFYRQAFSDFGDFGSNIAGPNGVLSPQDVRGLIGQVATVSKASSPAVEVAKQQLTEAQKQTSLLQGMALAAPAGSSSGGQTRSLQSVGGQRQPLFTSEGPQFYQAAFKHNSAFALPGPYQTKLSSDEEQEFRKWVKENNVPFDVNAKTVDYDMRGYWKSMVAGNQPAWKQGSHFPDTFKTPYDTTFSAESKYAKQGTPFVWKGDNLIDTRTGAVIFGTAPVHKNQLSENQKQTGLLGSIAAAVAQAGSNAGQRPSQRQIDAARYDAWWLGG